MVAKTVLGMTSRLKIVTVNPAQVPMSWDRNYSEFSFINLVIYFQLTVVGLPGVIGHHVPKHVGMELVKDPEEYKHLLKMVDPNVKDQQGRLKTVMNKIVQVNKSIGGL